MTAKLLLWNQRGLRPKVAFMGGIQRSKGNYGIHGADRVRQTAPFATILAKHTVGQRVGLRYSAGILWNAGVAADPVRDQRFGFLEVFRNTNPLRNFAIWHYSAAADFPIAGPISGTVESYGGTGFHSYIPGTHAFTTGVRYTRKAATLQMRYARSVSNFPVAWSLGVDAAYQLRWRRHRQ